MIEQYIARRPSAFRIGVGPTRSSDWGLVFATPLGQPLDGAHVTRVFQRASLGVGMPRLRFHDLRHTCATTLLAGPGSSEGRPRDARSLDHRQNTRHLFARHRGNACTKRPRARWERPCSAKWSGGARASVSGTLSGFVDVRESATHPFDDGQRSHCGHDTLVEARGPP
jgi:hypothetical protein